MLTAFEATIQLYPSNSGGRSEVLAGGEWRVLLAFQGGKAPARLTFTGEPAPGETFVASVELLQTDPAIPIQKETRFIVWDGGTRGVGIVESLAADSPP